MSAALRDAGRLHPSPTPHARAQHGGSPPARASARTGACTRLTAGAVGTTTALGMQRSQPASTSVLWVPAALDGVQGYPLGRGRTPPHNTPAVASQPASVAVPPGARQRMPSSRPVRDHSPQLARSCETADLLTNALPASRWPRVGASHSMVSLPKRISPCPRARPSPHQGGSVVVSPRMSGSLTLPMASRPTVPRLSPRRAVASTTSRVPSPLVVREASMPRVPSPPVSGETYAPPSSSSTSGAMRRHPGLSQIPVMRHPTVQPPAEEYRSSASTTCRAKTMQQLLSEFTTFATVFMPRMGSAPRGYRGSLDELVRVHDAAAEVQGQARSLSEGRRLSPDRVRRSTPPIPDMKPPEMGLAFLQSGDASAAERGGPAANKEKGGGPVELEEEETFLPDEEEECSALAHSSLLGASGLLEGSAMSPCSVDSSSPTHRIQVPPAKCFSAEWNCRGKSSGSAALDFVASPMPAPPPSRASPNKASSSGAWSYPALQMSPEERSVEDCFRTPPARCQRFSPVPKLDFSAPIGEMEPFGDDAEGGDRCPKRGAANPRGLPGDGATPPRFSDCPLEAQPSCTCSQELVSEELQQLSGANEGLSSPRSTSRVCSPSHGSVLSPRSPPSPAVLFPGDGDGAHLPGDMEDGVASMASMRVREDAFARSPLEVESIPNDMTMLHAILAEDGMISRRDREVQIRVPEGVGTDLKVRINTNNMLEELFIPSEARAGEVVSCELPTVRPLTSVQQRTILYEGILMTRLRWVQRQDGSWVTDELRKMKKHEAYRTLRGRRMGLVLVAIPEEEP
mmetsp:Transcript_49358/g.155219  ORF Transcript_49358/g.155219 Transcript_49358/m.155219 type:complete len:799 (-) Transcript_49358:74-2470(-)